MVGVGGVAEDALVLLVEAVHRPPRQRDLAVEHGRVLGERHVLPGATVGLRVSPATSNQAVSPRSRCAAAMVARLQRAVGEVGEREVGDRVAAGLEQQHGVVALDDRAAAELGAQPAPQRLGVEHALRHPGHEELAVGVAAQRPLLP